MTTTQDALDAYNRLLNDFYLGLKNSRPEEVRQYDTAIVRESLTRLAELEKAAEGMALVMESAKQECMSIESIKAPSRALGSIAFMMNEALVEYEKLKGEKE